MEVDARNETPDVLCEHARELFLNRENTFGCAETVYITLKRYYGLSDPDDSGSAMALNGGVAYSGNVCGAILGAALAIGQDRKRACGRDHKAAKTVARQSVRAILDRFQQEFGSTLCGTLTGYDISIPGEHERFIQSGVWKTVCMRQIEFVLRTLAEIENQNDAATGAG